MQIMKIKILLLLLVSTSSFCYSQLKIVTGEVLFMLGSQNIYTNENLINDGTVTLGTGKLYIAGDVDNNNILTLSNGTLTVTGTKTQTFDFASADVTKRIELDKASGTATFNSGSLVITDGLLSTQGTINGGGKLIMRSTATKTAIVEQSTGGAVDNIVVERYIPSKRAYRFLSSPVTTSTSINSNWQENQNNTATAYASNSNTVLDYGTHITGSTIGANGFDATQTGAASLFQFNNTTQAWSSISNTNANTLNVGGSYRLMVRGSRLVDLTNNVETPSPTTINRS
jgi:formylmethanofuran dehydrogenase subunit C